MELLEHLRKRQADGRPIRVGLVGCGQEGSGMVHITHKMAGMETVAIADLDVNRPLRTLHDLGNAGWIAAMGFAISGGRRLALSGVSCPGSSRGQGHR